MFSRRLVVCFCAVFSAGGFIPASAQEGAAKTERTAATYAAMPEQDGITVTRNGQMVARILANSGSKPVIWPLVGPDGVQMTRAYPMEEARPGEADDHVHHRSVWFTHGDVNGVDFWAEGDGHGKIVQRDAKVRAAENAVAITTENDWIGPEGERVLSDQRQIEFRDLGDMRAIDFTITLRATDGPVTFGDTKEGSFGVRVAGEMKVDAGKGGRIITSRGAENADAWGKPAEWVDYSGPIDGQTYGVAILNHPTSYGFPTRWHVRTYGLFAANPFGVAHFTGGEPTDGVTLADGESMTLRYRMLLHRGDAEDAGVAEAWEQYISDVPAGPESGNQ